jgi:GrpB-like predicted nucleotidyltransferase (UPF0157 family)
VFIEGRGFEWQPIIDIVVQLAVSTGYIRQQLLREHGFLHLNLDSLWGTHRIWVHKETQVVLIREADCLKRHVHI